MWRNEALGMVKAWKGILTKPEETIAAQKSKASLAKGLLNYAIAALVVGIPVGIIVGLLAMFTSIIPGTEYWGIWSLLAVPAVAIAVMAVVLVCSLASNLVIWGAAKIFEGKGSYVTQYYLLSLISVPVLSAFLVGYVATIVLSIVPGIGLFLGILGALAFYAIVGYVSIVSTMAFVSALKTAHDFTTAKVAMTSGISTALLAVILVIIAVILIVLLLLAGATDLISSILALTAIG